MPRLVQLTDTHIYADADARFDGLDTRASFAAVLRAALADGPNDGLLLTGDLAMDGSVGAYAYLNRMLPLSPVPLTIPGNHDDPLALTNAAPRLARAWPCTVDYGHWRLLCLSTCVSDAPHGTLGPAQLAWLATQLSLPYAGHTALVMHHPPIAIGSPWLDSMGLTDDAALWDLLHDASGVCLIVCGHVHQTVDCRVRGVRVLASPSTCIQFAPRARRYQTEARSPGYRVLTLADDGRIETSIVRVPL